jgi:thiol-disulfide isomerase/thioredoxin
VIHDQDILNSESRLAAELGIAPWLAAGIVVPLRVFSTSIRYLDDSGRPVMIENPFVHHHNETLVGVGDPWLFGRTAVRRAGFMLGARLGVALPLGRTEEDPFRLGDMGLPHEHSQFGTGTFEPLAGVEASRDFGPVRVELFGLTLQSLYANGDGYRAGDRYAGGLGAASGLGTTRWRFRTTLEIQHETAERWNGMVRSDEGNVGRTDVLAGAIATYRLTDDWYLGASLKLPVYTRVQGGQLDASTFVGLSIGTQVRLFEGAGGHGHGHDHDHDHGHAAPAAPTDWTGLDKEDVTNDGSAVPLVPVPGKITVFDFWATWCEPCADVDRELAALARRHPGDVAVRKVNVVDVESPAWRTYLGDATLPHLKVYGRDGKLLWERSAPPRTLASEVEKLVTEPAR